MMNDQAFWFVWNVNGRVPQYRHSSKSSAIEEAKRLARLNRGEQFAVLQSLVMYRSDDLQVTDLRPHIVDEIPF